MTRILVVDDNPEDRELVRRCLHDDEELELVFANDGEEALGVMAEMPPDMVLTDLRMPNLDGLQLVEKVAASYPQVPVVLMTARGSEQIAVQALHAGASSYVPKSDLVEELADTVWSVLDLAEARRSRAELAGHLAQRETVFRLATDLDLISPLVAFVQEGLEAIGFGNEGMRSQIGIALMEALANAMVRGNLEVGSELRRSDRDAYDALIERRRGQEPYGSRKVEFVARESTKCVEYRITDEGPGFDPAGVPDPTSAENLLAVSGRGIMLMRTFMDEVEFGPRGNRVTLTRRESEDPSAEGT